MLLLYTLLLGINVLHLTDCFRTAAVIGSYSIDFSAKTLPHITVSQLDSNGGLKRLVWFTSPSTEELLVAQEVQQTVEQNGGDYVFHETVLKTCNKSVLTAMSQATTSAATISGVLCDEYNFTISFTLLQPSQHLGFNVTLADSTHTFNKVTLVYGCNKDEGFYGLGEQYTYINFKGHSVPLFLSEQGVGRGAEPITFLINLVSAGSGGNAFTTYSRVPFYMTSYSRALFIESLDYAIMHFTDTDVVKIEINTTSITGRIITGDSLLDIIESFTSFSGRMKALPDWVHNGAVLGLQGGTKIVSNILNQVKEVMGSWEDVAGVWLQDWTGQRNVTANNGKMDLPRTGLWWNWEIDREHYPGWEDFVKKLNSEGIRVLTYINPLFDNVTKRGTPFNRNYYEEGLKAGYFIKHGPLQEVWKGYSNSCLVDLTNPSAYDWITEMIIENMLATNISGWMCDFGESVPLDAALYDGQNPSRYHTVYSEVWGQLNMEAIEKAVSRKIITKEQASEVVYFMRSGSTHSPKVTPMFWLGDQLVSWDHYDGLKSAIIGAITSGLSGFTMIHSDIGGYTSIKVPNITFLSYIRSERLLMRWCEFSAFTVMYRSHQGTLPDENTQFYTNNKTMNQYFRMARVYKSWKFYRQDLIQEAVDHGWPVIRHMMLVFPDNPRILSEDLRYQYMLGTELLVAPVHEEWTEYTAVFLPANTTWVNVWTNDTYKGANDWHAIDAPMGYPTVLFLNGSKIGEKFVENLSHYLGPFMNKFT